jgi:hypothetical protein
VDAWERGPDPELESRELTPDERRELVTLLAERGWFGAVGAAVLARQPEYRAAPVHEDSGVPTLSSMRSERITRRPLWSVRRQSQSAGATR